MKNYSDEQLTILKYLLTHDTISVPLNSRKQCDYLSREHLLCMDGLTHESVTYRITPEGEAYIAGYYVENERYQKAIKDARIAKIISVIAIIVSLGALILSAVVTKWLHLLQ